MFNILMEWGELIVIPYFSLKNHSNRSEFRVKQIKNPIICCVFKKHFVFLHQNCK